MTKLPDSVESVRQTVLAWIDACGVTAASLSATDALQTYHSYREWTFRNAGGHVTAPYFCQIVHEALGTAAMTNTKALYQREVD